jgi:hypothetical protein
MRSVAECTSCTRCGTLLTVDAMKLADVIEGSKLAEMQKKYPGLIFRRVRKVFAICTKCRAEFTWNDTSGKFSLIQEAA